MKAFKYITFVLFILVASPILRAQDHDHSHHNHDHPEDALNKENFLKVMKKMKQRGFNYDTVEHHNEVNKHFSIALHIFTDSTGQTGYNEETFRNVSIPALNNEFAPIGLTFSLCEVRILKDWQYDTIEDLDAQRANFLSVSYVPNVINVYLVSSLMVGPINAAGVASLPGGTTPNCDNHDFIMFTKTSTTSSTLYHEFGHFFGLLHTFEKSNGNELVNGSNCSSSGDLVCDTSADPFIPGTTDSNVDCDSYESPTTDVNGDYYLPPFSNYMTYYRGCRSQFTPQQYNRMAFFATTYRMCLK